MGSHIDIHEAPSSRNRPQLRGHVGAYRTAGVPQTFKTPAIALLSRIPDRSLHLKMSYNGVPSGSDYHLQRRVSCIVIAMTTPQGTPSAVRRFSWEGHIFVGVDTLLFLLMAFRKLGRGWFLHPFLRLPGPVDIVIPGNIFQHFHLGWSRGLRGEGRNRRRYRGWSSSCRGTLVVPRRANGVQVVTRVGWAGKGRGEDIQGLVRGE